MLARCPPPTRGLGGSVELGGGGGACHPGKVFFSMFLFVVFRLGGVQREGSGGRGPEGGVQREGSGGRGPEGGVWREGSESPARLSGAPAPAVICCSAPKPHFLPAAVSRLVSRQERARDQRLEPDQEWLAKRLAVLNNSSASCVSGVFNGFFRLPLQQNKSKIMSHPCDCDQTCTDVHRRAPVYVQLPPNDPLMKLRGGGDGARVPACVCVCARVAWRAAC